MNTKVIDGKVYDPFKATKIHDERRHLIDWWDYYKTKKGNYFKEYGRWGCCGDSVITPMTEQEVIKEISEYNYDAAARIFGLEVEEA